MADSTIDGLPTIGSIDRTTDKIPIWDASDSSTGEMTINSMLGFSGGNPVSTTDTQTLTNKTLTSPTITTPTITVNDDSFTLRDNTDTTKQAMFQLSSITAGNTRFVTIPDASLIMVGTTTTQTLTNKTLTSPTINNPTLNVDTISEFTSANGVNIDGLLIKDGLLPAGNIQPLNLQSGTGSSWTWQTWTPTWTNVSGGTTNYAKYIQIGKTVFFRIKYTLAGAGVSGAVTFTTPVNMNAEYALETPVAGTASFLDSGTNLYPAEPIAGSATTIILRPVNAGATNATMAANASSTNPFTWASGDEIKATGFYEVA